MIRPDWMARHHGLTFAAEQQHFRLQEMKGSDVCHSTYDRNEKGKRG